MNISKILIVTQPVVGVLEFVVSIFVAWYSSLFEYCWRDTFVVDLFSFVEFFVVSSPVVIHRHIDLLIFFCLTLVYYVDRDRRDQIVHTWWRECKETLLIVITFATSIDSTKAFFTRAMSWVLRHPWQSTKPPSLSFPAMELDSSWQNEHNDHQQE